MVLMIVMLTLSCESNIQGREPHLREPVKKGLLLDVLQCDFFYSRSSDKTKAPYCWIFESHQDARKQRLLCYPTKL